MKGRNPWLVLGTLLMGMFVIGVSSTSVNTAIPAVSSDLGATFDELLWMINIYALVIAVLVITAGRLGDLYGPRRLFIVGLSVFALASVACGLAQSPHQLILARVLQGIGGALVSPQSLSMISQMFPPERRGRAIGIWGAVAGSGAAAGVLLGGRTQPRRPDRLCRGLALDLPGERADLRPCRGTCRPADTRGGRWTPAPTGCSRLGTGRRRTVPDHVRPPRRPVV